MTDWPNDPLYPPMFDQFQEILLEKMRYAVWRRVSREFAHECTLHTQLAHHTLNEILIMLERDVLAHQVAIKTSYVPVRGRMVLPEPPQLFMVVIPPGRIQSWLRSGWRDRARWLNWARRPLRKLWLPPAGHAALNIPVEGEAEIDVRYMHTFPESTIDYGPQLGPLRQRLIVGEPRDWRAHPDGRW